MDVLNTVLDGVRQISVPKMRDDRGSFNKFFHFSEFEKNGMRGDFRECYFTTSKKGVVRGMHFQTPPCDHAKLVTIISGSALDVVLDLRKKSKTFGCYASFHLSEDEPSSIYIPEGFAHGFAARSDCTLLYNVTSEYSPRQPTRSICGS